MREEGMGGEESVGEECVGGGKGVGEGKSRCM